MADFSFNLLAHSPERLNVIATRFGTGGVDQWTDKEIGKAVKIGANANHVQCANGDEIQAVVDNISDGGTEGGYTFGGAARGNRGFRVKAVVGPNQTGNAGVDDLVVADTQLAVGTEGVARVRTGTPTRSLWRVMQVKGTGAPGDELIIELI